MKILGKTKRTLTTENILLNKINTILSRKDILELENDRVDTLRMLTYLIENNGRPSQLIKFLKAG